MARISKPRKHGKRWQISYYDAAGKRRWASYDSHAEAVKALRAFQAEADAIKAGARRLTHADKTFDELCELWLDVKRSKRTIRDDESRIRVHLRPALSGKKLIDITPAVISRLHHDTAAKVSTGTVRQVLTLLRAMLNLAVEHDWLLAAPRVRLPKAPEKDYRWLRSEEEMAKLLEAARDTGYPGLVELYGTALYTGMRAGELCGLHWEDVDFDRRVITVQRSFKVPTKTGRIRRVPMLDPLIGLLGGWRERCHSAVLVFPNKQGNMHVSGARVMNRTFVRCLENAGLQRLSFHDLRHTFASHWMLKGGEIYRLQRILGHASIQMTQRYAHLGPEVFEQDYGRFGDFVPDPNATR